MNSGYLRRAQLTIAGFIGLGIILALSVLFTSGATTAVSPTSTSPASPAPSPTHLPPAISQLPLATSTPHALLPIITAPDPPPDEPIPFGPIHEGEATYYHATGAGNCAFPATPDDLLVVAMNTSDYNNAALCGAYIHVTGPDGTVIARVTDRCPSCAAGDLDLSREAFAHIADLAAGRVDVTWQLVSMPLDGPIVYHFKEGSNEWWTAVQIRNHRHPITQLEVQTGQNTFQNIPHTDYNYFVAAAGLGPGPYTFRVTDYFGQALVDIDISHIENGEVPGNAQFPPPIITR